MPVVSLVTAISELLTGYAPGPEEARAMATMTGMLDSHPEPWSATTFEPGHFTASAYVTDPGLTVLLMVLHRKLGRWLQPGGHIEPDDVSPLAAARREVMEETGVDVVAGGPLVRVDAHRIPATGTQPAHMHFDMTFHLHAVPGEVVGGDGVAAARWVALDRVPDITDDASLLRGIALLSAGAL